MYIYLRMITDNDTKKQIETTAEAYQYFFSGDINNSEGVVIEAEDEKKNKASFRISKGAGSSNSYRFSSYNNGITLGNFLNNINGEKYKFGDIIKIIKKNKFFMIYLITKNSEEYENLKSLLENNENNSIFIVSTSSTSTTFIQNHDQTIYYGVPGSGKSHKIDSEIKSKITDKTEREEQTIRVVFHPEYTNADFVGQILPHVEDTVDYRFKAGPFSRILKKAYENPTKPYFLVIEEINRGNAAAIFGDFFQLLDRDSDGWSSYSVENLDINAFIRSNDSTYTDKYSDIPTTKEIGNTTWTENTGIRLPPNLSILASMNTSDQNVFTLDNAFQRRWDMELVPNNCADSIQMGAKIGDTGITWGNFQSKINEIIGNAANESGFSSMEDKRLGCWFIKNENENIDKEKFANKVLKYLWDDAFKFNRTEIFVDGIKNFEDLKQKFKSDGFSIFNNVDFAIETKTASEVESNDNSSEENQSEESTEN